MGADATANNADSIRDDAYLLRCLKAPRVALIRADEKVEVKRVISFGGPLDNGFKVDRIYIDVACVYGVTVVVEHPSDVPCQRLGVCSPRCRNCGFLIRYEENGVRKSKMVLTMYKNLKSDLVPELVAKIKREIEHGTSTVIDPEEMVLSLLNEAGPELEAGVAETAISE